MIYRLDNFIENEINPITQEKYDDSWVIFILNNESYQMKCGSENGCAYTLRVSKQCTFWKMALCDFIGYNEAIGRNGIIVVSENDLQDAKIAYAGHSYKDSFLRTYESRIMVHSTTFENYQSILKCDALKSWNALRKSKMIAEEYPIGMQLGDPTDLRDYILFGTGTTGEIVVNSKQANRLIYDENVKYKTGARLYFDMKKIAEDGLLIRDGGEMKVKDTLKLKPYLVWVATWENVGLEDSISTPRIFAEKADKLFRKYYGEIWFLEGFSYYDN